MEKKINYDSVSSINEFLNDLNLAPQKRFGQNFLINRGARQKIIDALELKPDDELWEIGPGLGAMTAMAMDYHCSVKVFEIDRAYQTILNSFFDSSPNFTLIAGDVLKTWTMESTSKNLKVLGNLPYNIAAAIIQLFWEKPLDRAVITVQKEMADRMTSKSKTKDYSSFSVWCQSHFHLKNLGKLKPGSFYPVPHVDSAILSMVKRTDISDDLDRMLNILTKSAFANRRKTIRNNWLNIFDHHFSGQLTYASLVDSMAAVGVTEQMRAEEIEVNAYIEIAKSLLQKI